MEDKRFETQAIRTQIPLSQNNEHSSPLYLTSSFVFDSAEAMKEAFNDQSDEFIYSRYGNPNTKELVDKMCLLEGTEAGIATASGMAAIFTSLAALLQSGDHIISCASIFGATHTILNKYFPRWNISYSYFNSNDVESIEALIQENTKIIYVESPTNPGIEIVDLDYLSRIAKKHNVLLMVDNCFATPALQQPAKFGADLIVHSATKYIDGQGRVLGGLVLGSKAVIEEIYLFGRITGPSLSPFNAWVLSKSLETLALRMERHSENALYVATQLQAHKSIEFVNYPFLPSHANYEIAKKQMKAGGGIVTFNLKGGYDSAKRVLDRLKMIKISPNLGDARTIATHPASSTHCKLSEQERLAVGIFPGLIRISVGLENKSDILQDLVQALES